MTRSAESHATTLRADRRSGMARPGYEPDSAGERPRWLKVRLSQDRDFFRVRDLVRSEGLHTVCESASCPNIGECWSSRALTFMILGDVCTRSCGFCDVQTGRPGAVDPDEASRVAESLASIGLRYAVVTSVDRDDLPDGGAAAWAQTVREIKARCPDMELEVLTPDFKGDLDRVMTVLDAGPDVFAHNVETVARLHPLVRPQARFERSLDVLHHAREHGKAVVKSGLMLGIGEDDDEVLETMRFLAGVGVEILSVGQYMRPSGRHLPVTRWVPPEAFEAIAEAGREMGFAHVEAGPLVRSSYRADRQAAAAAAARPSRHRDGGA